MTFLRLGLFGRVLLKLCLRGKASFRLVRLGGHKVRKVRGNAADVHDAGDIFLYRDSSVAPLLEMWRRFKAVVDVLDSLISCGVTLSPSVELTAQWSKILSLRPLYLVMLDDLHAGEGFGLGDVHRRLSDFIHGVVVHRRDEAIGSGVIGQGRILWFTLTSGSGLIWFLPPHFSSVSPFLLLVVLGCLLIQPRIPKGLASLLLPFWAKGYQL